MKMNEIEKNIKVLAEQLDNSLEKKDIEEILGYFSPNCRIKLLDYTLVGHKGVRKWLDWMFSWIDSMKFEPIVILVQENIFFEEFIVNATTKKGIVIKSRQSETLVYDGDKVVELRLYFDPLDLAIKVVNNPIEKRILGFLRKKITSGLT